MTQWGYSCPIVFWRKMHFKLLDRWIRVVNKAENPLILLLGIWMGMRWPSVSPSKRCIVTLLGDKVHGLLVCLSLAVPTLHWRQCLTPNIHWCGCQDQHYNRKPQNTNKWLKNLIRNLSGILEKESLQPKFHCFWVKSNVASWCLQL